MPTCQYSFLESPKQNISWMFITSLEDHFGTWQLLSSVTSLIITPIPCQMTITRTQQKLCPLFSHINKDNREILFKSPERCLLSQTNKKKTDIHYNYFLFHWHCKEKYFSELANITTIYLYKHSFLIDFITYITFLWKTRVWKKKPHKIDIGWNEMQFNSSRRGCGRGKTWKTEPID